MPTSTGLELNRRFFHAVRPLLARHFPDLRYAAAHLGPGSDVLGFDTDMSKDHDWGPGFTLFLEEKSLISSVTAVLGAHLPETFEGYPTWFSRADDGVLVPGERKERRFIVTDLSSFVARYLAFDGETLTDLDWLTFPSQRLLEVTSGEVYADEVGALSALRKKLAWYPENVYLFLLAAQWQRVGQEQALMSRAGQVGDDLGSRLIGSRLVRDAIRIGFLLERRYAPYAKWLGTAFKKLSLAEFLLDALEQSVQADTWQVRESALNRAFTQLAVRHNELKLSEPIPEQPVPFHTRPFRVMNTNDIVATLLNAVKGEDLQRLAARAFTGSVDQLSDNTDLLAGAALRPKVVAFYRSLL